MLTMSLIVINNDFRERDGDEVGKEYGRLGDGRLVVVGFSVGIGQ